ncbi:MAG: ABC transporter permease [Gaiellaceae bacterium]
MRAFPLLIGKDLRTLWRSPMLLTILCLYPLLISGLVGLVAGYANSRPNVALVDLDNVPAVVKVGGHNFHIQNLLRRVRKDAHVVPMSESRAAEALRRGQVVGVITIPRGFVTELKSMRSSPTLQLETSHGGIAPRVSQQMQALVYSLNLKLQDAYVESATRYANMLQQGGSGDVLGHRIDIIGIRRAEHVLDSLPPGPEIERLRAFLVASDAALELSKGSMRSIATPIKLQVETKKKTWLLSADVQAYALALTVTFLAMALAAASLAAERDENVAARLARGLVRPSVLVAAKIALAAALSLASAMVITSAFGAVIEIGRVQGGEPWSRVPLVLVGVALASCAVGGMGALLGALARDGRSASLLALLVTLPIVLLGLVPREIAHAGGLVSDAFPFAHAVRLVGSALYDPSPWATVLPEGVWLAGLALVYGLLARLALPRLLSA